MLKKVATRLGLNQLLILVLIVRTSAISSCYVGTSPSDVITGCVGSYCQTVMTTVSSGATYVKSCQSSCTASYVTSGSTYTRTTCCSTDNCNGVPVATCYVGQSPNDVITTCPSGSNYYCQTFQTSTMAGITTNKYCKQSCSTYYQGGDASYCCQTANCNSGIPSYTASSTSAFKSFSNNLIVLLTYLISVYIK